MRQARERQISIKFRHANLSWFADLADARYRRKDRHQVCGTGEDQILTALRCQRKIAGKLKRIAGSLPCGSPRFSLVSDGRPIWDEGSETH